MKLRLRLRPSAGTAALVALALHAAPSAAVERAGSKPCEGAPAPPVVEEAKEAFHTGETAYKEGDYPKAIEHWSVAYEKDCTAHALLLNLATAHELLHESQQAIHALRLFNRRLPQSPYVEPNFKRIIRLKDRQEQENAKAKEEERLRADVALSAVAPPPTSLASESTGARWLPIGVIGGGLLTLLAGAGIYAEAQSAEKNANTQCGGIRSRCQDFEAVLLGERARSRSDIGALLSMGGLAVTTAGTLWFWLGADEPEIETGRLPNHLEPIRIGALAGDREFQLSVSGAF